METISAWSYGLAGFAYAIFGIFQADGWNAGTRSRMLLIAVALSAAWGAVSLAFTLSGHTAFLAGSLTADLLRYAGWFAFLLLLECPDPGSVTGISSRWKQLRVIAIGLIAIGLSAQFLVLTNLASVIQPQRIVLLNALGIAVFSLVLAEQLLRNVTPDSRWSIKPLCLGFGGAALFDLYLYSDALLFSRIDADAFSIRGFIHALAVPLIAVSTSRSRDWKKRLVLSQRAALQSASLLVTGLYLLFISAAGYYVRYFGGDWGRALQIAVVFAAMLLLAVLALSGSIRAKLRVLIG